MRFTIFRNIGNLKNFLLFFGASVLVFDLNYYFMSNLPGYENLQCVMGAGLKPENIVFSILMSLMTGLLIVGVVSLVAKRRLMFAASSFSGIGLVVGIFTIFCPACTLPVISLFGFAFGFTFFTTYNLIFKVISLTFMFFGLYILNKQLSGNCSSCKKSSCKI